MRILVIATKAPWPPVDGGRLVLLRTLECLRAAGHHVDLVAPVDGSAADLAEVAAELESCCTPRLVGRRPPGALATLTRAVLHRRPLSIARHRSHEVGRAVAEVLAGGGVDVVHAEQLQSVEQARAADKLGVPVVLRAHNVESDLWRFGAAHRRGVVGRLYQEEAGRLAAWEGRAVRRLQATVALTERDRLALAALSGRAEKVHHVPAPFPGHLEPGLERLPGVPPVVLLASRGWLPNEDAARRFAGRTWRLVRDAAPGARLHVFGVGGGLAGRSDDGIHWHPPPADSAAAFPAGAVAVIPPRHATGVPMKGLEAWARGIPVVAASEAAVSLEATSGRELLVADDAEGIAEAISRLATEPELGDRLVKAGREALSARHDPAKVAEGLAAVYEEAASSPDRRRAARPAS